MTNPSLHSNVQATGAKRRPLSLLTTETTALTPADTDATKDELPLEQALHQRAIAMTDLLTRIMDRPAAPRFWGIND